jgi:hypothetical protein
VVGFLVYPSERRRKPVAWTDHGAFCPDVLASRGVRAAWLKLFFLFLLPFLSGRAETHKGTLLLARRHGTDIDGCPGPEPARLVPHIAGIDRLVGTGICFKDVCDVSIGQVDKVAFHPGDEVALGSDGCGD